MNNTMRKPDGSGRAVWIVAAAALMLTAAVPAPDATGTVAGTVTVKGRSADNTVVYIKQIEATPEPAGTPASLELDQKDKVFRPHLLPLQVGQQVHFKNGDSFNHNIHVYRGRRTLLNVIQGIDGENDWKPPRRGTYLVTCDIHTEMSAFVFAFDHPFFTSVPAAARSDFNIVGLPAGTYTLVAVRDVNKRLQRQEKEVVIRAGETASVDFVF